MDPPLVIGLGELLWDVFPDSRRPGGAPANVAFHATQLGVHGAVASRVGNDADGDELRAFLLGKGLDVSLLQTDPTLPTGRVTVELTADGQPVYVIHQQVAWERLTAEENLLQAAARAAAICFGTLAQRSEASRSAIHAALQAAGESTLIVYDVNLRQHWYAREWIERSLQAADVVKMNEDELRTLAPLLAGGSADAKAFARRLKDAFHVETLVLTRGERGCLVIRGDETVDVPGRAVEVVDAVGAGDAFTAAFIVGTLERKPLEQVADFANGIGGLVASRAGAMPDIAADAATMRSRSVQG
jgi:fructokinase